MNEKAAARIAAAIVFVGCAIGCVVENVHHQDTSAILVIVGAFAALVVFD